MKNTDLHAKFQEYFNELEGYGLRSERFYNLLDGFSNDPALAASMTKWLEAAFMQGAKVMAQDSLDALRDYATAVSGIDKVCYNSTQAFDASADNLMLYYGQILGMLAPNPTKFKK